MTASEVAMRKILLACALLAACGGGGSSAAAVDLLGVWDVESMTTVEGTSPIPPDELGPVAIDPSGINSLGANIVIYSPASVLMSPLIYAGLGMVEDFERAPRRTAWRWRSLGQPEIHQRAVVAIVGDVAPGADQLSLRAELESVVDNGPVTRWVATARLQRRP